MTLLRSSRGTLLFMQTDDVILSHGLHVVFGHSVQILTFLLPPSDSWHLHYRGPQGQPTISLFSTKTPDKDCWIIIKVAWRMGSYTFRTCFTCASKDERKYLMFQKLIKILIYIMSCFLFFVWQALAPSMIIFCRSAFHSGISPLTRIAVQWTKSVDVPRWWKCDILPERSRIGLSQSAACARLLEVHTLARLSLWEHLV